MTEQPLERRVEEQPRPVRGITHKRHGCGIAEPLCGFMPQGPNGEPSAISTITPDLLPLYQPCVVCESLWDEARVLQATCSHCGKKIKP